MRIRAIRGRGLASLAAPFEIDLDAEPMRGAGVFVIGGPTGAGKSTILDAMCLALFDRAPRVARAPQREVIRAGARPDDAPGKVEVASDAIRACDPRALVRRGARHAFAEVDFDGRGGGSFRARWEVRGVQRRGGGWSLGKPAMSLIGISSVATSGVPIGTTKTEVLLAIEHRLGLDFSQFCRSVLLPQGDLASFLESPDDERARLLERVTGTEIYSSLSRVVHGRAATLGREARERSVAIEAVTLLTETQREGLLSEREEARVEVARAQKRVVELVAIERAHEAARIFAGELAQSERELDDVTRQLGLWEPRRGDVERGQRARAVRAERQASLRADAELARADVEHTTLVERLARLAPERDRTASRLDVELAGLLALEARGTALEEALARHEQALADLSQRAGADHALSQARHAAESSAGEAARREREAKKVADAFERELLAIEREVSRDERSRSGASVEPLAAVLRAELVGGVPCPVCGSREHPAKADDTHAKSDQRAAKDALEAIETRQRRASRVAQLRLESSRAQATLTARREETERARVQLATATVAAEESTSARAAARRVIEAEHGAEPPAMRRATHHASVVAARGRVASIERELAERAAQWAHLSGQREAASVQVDSLDTAAVRAREMFDAALVAHHLDLADVVAAERVDDRELAGWAAELTRLDGRREQQRAVVSERRRRFHEAEAAMPSGLPAREEIEAARRDAERSRTQAEQIEAIAASRLSDDDARRTERERRRDALGALESEAATWETLSRLIGSADGKKLRVIVQSMALDLLLSHSNVQLHTLAPRYRLVRRSAQSMALDVIDAELGGGPRSTSSLSGGERFLVSLALALGLGTMTAERDDVGSLFLDEGFGSLDEESLEQALEALDALRQAGRQIGVVSHVARLSERFDVRVEVRPSVHGEPGASTVHVTTT